MSAYRIILGREPESEEAIRSALGYGNIETLRRAFMTSEEFGTRVAPGLVPRHFRYDLDPGGQSIDVECDAQAMAQLLGRVESTWSRLGVEDPYWSVASQDEYRASNFEENQESFWNSGKGDVERLQRWLTRNKLELPAKATCLEYGCGTGRVTRWLAQEFDRVIACDISENHINLARQAIGRLSQKVTFFHVGHLACLDELPEFNLLFSYIVLQHNPPPVIAYILDKLLARLSPSGIAYFQVVTAQPDYNFSLEEYLASTDIKDEGIEMHVLPQRAVFKIAMRHGCEPVEVLPDDWTPSLPYASTTFLLKKRAHASRLRRWALKMLPERKKSVRA